MAANHGALPIQLGRHWQTEGYEMSKIEQINAVVTASADGFLSEHDVERSDYSVKAMVAEVASTVHMEPSDIEAHISKFELVRRSDGRVTSVNYGQRPGVFHLPWPLNCHKKFEICWPQPDRDLISCFEVEIPWTCP
jgi:hypothetical protein